MADFKTILSSIFGGKNPIDSIGSIIDKYHVSPEDRLAMQAEIDKVMEEKRQYALQMYSQNAADTDSARKMNTAIQGYKPSWLAKNVPYIIAIFILVVWGAVSGYLFGSMLKLINNDKVDYANLMALYSSITAIATIIVGYYFGSSTGSAEKQKMIDRLTSE